MAGEEETGQEQKTEHKTSFLDAVKDLYEKGKEYAVKLYQRAYFDVATTPNFMKKLGLTGEKFTIRYGVISRHSNKDSSHYIPEETWRKLPDALKSPFAISKYLPSSEEKGKGNAGGYRIYTALRHDGGFIVVGVDVKNAGRDLEVNAISTVFSRDKAAGSSEEVIYRSEKITPEQSSLLDGHNPRQYPTEQELSEAKDSDSSANPQEESAKEDEAKPEEQKDEKPTKLRAEDLFSKAARISAQNDRERLEKRVKPLENDKVKYVVYGSVDEIESASTREKVRNHLAQGKKVYAWTSTRNGVTTVRLFAPSFNGADGELELAKTILHETVQHYGVKKLLGDRYESVMRQVWKDRMSARNRDSKSEYVWDVNFSEAQKEAVLPGRSDAAWFELTGEERQAVQENAAVQAEAADEWLATMIETSGVEEQSWFRRFANAVRDALRRLGFNIEITDAEIAGLWNRSQRLIEEEVMAGREEAGSLFDMEEAGSDRFRFIGEKGAENADKAQEVTTRLDNLSVARQMEGQEKDAKAIKAATGWERGADGKWRYEEPDGEWIGGGKSKGFLTDFVRDDELYSEYPQLKNVFVTIGGSTAGNFDAKSGRLTINMDQAEYGSSPMEIVAHEIQHAIQHIEGFARGGSQRDFAEDGKLIPNSAVLREAKARAEYFSDYPENADYDYVKAEWETTDSDDKELRRWLADLMNYLSEGGSVADFKKEAANDWNTLKNELKEALTSSDSAYSKYMRLAGETESRNVTKRLGITAEDRLRSLRTETQDVADEDQIFIYEGLGENGSADDNLAEANERFNAELRRYDNGEMDKNEMFHLGRPHGVMRMFLPDLPIVMRQTIMTKGSVKKHNIEPMALENMPQYLSEPIFVFQRVDNALGVLTEMKDRNGKNVCVAISLSRTIQDGNNVLEVNDIRSIHGRNNADIVYPIVQNNTLVWTDKEKGLAWLSSASRSVQQEIDKQDLVSATNIVANFENPNIESEKRKEEIEQALSGNMEDSGGLRFRADRLVERKGNLIAVHNLREDNLRKALDLGGFPMPSIAVTTPEIGHYDYGDISLVFGSETIDPADRRNKVYTADAWTPTFPSLDLKINEKVRDKVRKKIDGLLDVPGMDYAGTYSLALDGSNMGDDLRRWGNFTDAYKDNTAMRIAFLNEKGIPFRPVMQEKKIGGYDSKTYDKVIERVGHGSAAGLVNLGYNEKMAMEPQLRQITNEYRKEWSGENYDKWVAKGLIDENKPLGFRDVDNLLYWAYQYEKSNGAKGIDRAATEKRVQNKFTKKLQNEFEDWLDNLGTGIVEKYGIRNGRDMYTPTGNRRSWESLHDDVTLDNVVSAMARQNEKGGDFFGGSPIHAAQERLGSMGDLRKYASTHLARIDQAEHDKIREEITGKFARISIPGVKEDFGGILDTKEVIIEAMTRSSNAGGIYRYIRKYYPGMTMEIAEEIAGLGKEIRAMQTAFLEAKPQRAVRFGEVRLAVVPEETDEELVNGLERYGIPVRTYNAKTEGARAKAVNEGVEEEHLMFREKDPSRSILKEEIEQTHSEAFKNWFGDWEADPEGASKIVNDDGEPKVVYHSTDEAPQNIEKFNRGRLGENTDSNASDESLAATAHVGFWTNEKPLADYGNSIPLYLNIRNPLGYDSLADLAGAISEHGGAEKFVEDMKQEGHDGLVVQDEEFGGESYVTFDENQLKHAEENNGDFSPEDDRIRFRIDGEDAAMLAKLRYNESVKEPSWKEKADALTDVTKKKSPNGVTSARPESNSPSRAEAPGLLPNHSEKSTAKVAKISYNLKELSGNISEKALGPNEMRFELARALGIENSSSDRSNYNVVNAGGNVPTEIRVSNHSGNVSYLREDNNVGIVIKTSNQRFRNDSDIDYVEFMYYGDKVNGNADLQREIIDGLRHYIETGSFEKMPEPDRLNLSGEYKKQIDRLDSVGRTSFRASSKEEAEQALSGVESQKTPDLIRKMEADAEDDAMFREGNSFHYDGYTADQLFDALDSATSRKNVTEILESLENRYGDVVRTSAGARDAIENGKLPYGSEIKAYKEWHHVEFVEDGKHKVEKVPFYTFRELRDSFGLEFTEDELAANDEANDFFRGGETNNFAKSREEFEERQKRAVAEKGIVAPGLKESEVDVVEIAHHSFDSDKPIEQARDWAKENIVGEHEMDNGDRYMISNNAVNKYLSKSATSKSANLSVHLSVLTMLPEVINASIDAEVHPDYKKGKDGVRKAENGVDNPNLLVHRMYGAVSIDGTTYRVKTTMHEYAPNIAELNAPHSYEVTEIEVLEQTNTSNNGAQDAALVNKIGPLGTAILLKDIEKSYDKGKKLLDVSEKDAEYRLSDNAPLSSTMAGRQRMAEHVQGLAERLHLGNVETLQSAGSLEGKKAGAKGFYTKSTGKITIVIPNNADIADAEKALLHEAVAHYGLRKMLGKDFDAFLESVFEHADKDVCKGITELARQRGWDFHIGYRSICQLSMLWHICRVMIN